MFVYLLALVLMATADVFSTFPPRPFIFQVRVPNLPAALQGTPGLFRVKFQGSTSGAKTIPRAADPYHSVEWSEDLMIVVKAASPPLRAVVQHSTNSAAGWRLMPAGHFDGAIVTALPNEWQDMPYVPSALTFYAQLSVQVKHGIPRDTRLPPRADMDKSFEDGGSGGCFAGSGANLYSGGCDASRTGADLDGSSGWHSGYSSAPMAWPSEVFNDARGSSAVATDVAGAGESAAVDLSPSSGSPSLGRGLQNPFAVPFPVPLPLGFSSDAILRSESPVTLGAHTSMTEPSEAPPGTVSMRGATSAGCVPRDSSTHGRDRHGFRLPEFRARAEAPGPESEQEPEQEPELEPELERPELAVARLPSPSRALQRSNVLDPECQLREEMPAGVLNHPHQTEQGDVPEDYVPVDGAGYKRPSLVHSAALGALDTEGQVKEVKIQRCSPELRPEPELELELERPSPACARLPSPAGAYHHSYLSDPECSPREDLPAEMPYHPHQTEQEEAEEYVPVNGAAYTRPNLVHSAALEALDTEERVHEVKTGDRSTDESEVLGSPDGAAPAAPPSPAKSLRNYQWCQSFMPPLPQPSTTGSPPAGNASAGPAPFTPQTGAPPTVEAIDPVPQETRVSSGPGSSPGNSGRNAEQALAASPRAVTLARSLGPDPSTFTSPIHAVELELEAGSLAEEVPFPVKVTQSLEFVECRTEGSGR